MNLWERELAPCESVLARLSAPGRLRLAVTALEWSYFTMREPIEDVEARGWIDQARAAAHAAVEEVANRITLAPAQQDAFRELDESVEEYGVAQFMTGFMAAAEVETLSEETLANILYICYVFAVQREEPEPESIEEQEANDRCLEVIAYHKELIRQAPA